MNLITPRKQRSDLVLVLSLAAVLCAGAATADDMSGAIAVPPPAAEGSAEGTVRLTAVAGGNTVGDAPMVRNTSVGDGTTIETGDDGNAAMLVDEDNLVELCAATKMKLTRNPKTGGRVIEVGAGTTRIIVEPGSSDEPLQIATPAAIATILGTVVYVTVDPQTGETTITSEDHPIRIESSDPNVTGSTIINGSEQLTIRPGEALDAKPKKLAKSVLENMSGCLEDIHGLALEFDRAMVATNLQNRMAVSDGGIVDLPVVGAEVGAKHDPPPPASDPPLELPDDCGVNCTVSPDEIPQVDDLPLPEPCGGIPGDGCFPFPEDYNPPS